MNFAYALYLTEKWINYCHKYDLKTVVAVFLPCPLEERWVL